MTVKIRGLEPRHLHNQRRANAIHEAVNEAIHFGLEIPVEWIEEYNELVHHTNDQSVFSHPVHDVERPEMLKPIRSWEVPVVPTPDIMHCGFGHDMTLPVCGVAMASNIWTTWTKEDVTCFQCKNIIVEQEEL